MKLCCFFNYAPHYRESIYKAIDETFDTQFYFGREVEYNKNSGIKKLDYTVFKRAPIEFENKIILKKFLWRTKLIPLAFKNFDSYLLTGDLSFSYIPFLLICRILGKKVYGWGHGPKTKDGKVTPIFWWFIKKLTGFFSYGENGRQRMIALGYPKDKVHVIYNSLNSNIFPNRSLLSNIYIDKFGNHNPTIIFIGRLISDKRIDKLIELLKKLYINNKPCNLVIVGNGPSKEELLNISDQNGLNDRIWFYGACYDDNINSKLLYNADLCITPGNVGLTALHSLTFGTPVISHNCFDCQGPEYEAIQPYKTGLLFEKDNYDDCYAKTCEWLEFAKGRREEIRRNCYDMINGKWNSRNQIKILKRVLEGNDNVKDTIN